MPLDETGSAQVMINALKNAAKVHKKFETMKKARTPERERDPGEPLTESTAALMTRPLRIELVFNDPIATRAQLDVLSAGVIRALMISQDHKRGPYRQRRDMRDVLREACVEIQIMQGKKPHLG